MKKNVIITRSYEDNVILAQKITELNLNSISSSMISHNIIACDFLKFQSYSNLIITSKFAAQIIAEHYPYDVDVYVVGEESADVLRRNKKLRVKEVYDKVVSLREAMKDVIMPLYLSGNHISEEISCADRYVIYNTEYAKILSSDAIEVISKNNVDFVMFYSKNSAQNFIDLIKAYNYLQNLQNSVVIAISQEVGDVVKAHVKNVLFPSKPNTAGMIELLEVVK